MIRLLALLALAPTTACLAIDDGEPAPYEIQVSWSMTNPPTNGYGTATITAPEDSIEAIGFAGSVRVYGMTNETTVEVCVNLAHRYVETIDGREYPFYAPIGQRCDDVPIRRGSVSFSF